MPSTMGMATASVLDARTLGIIEILPDVLLLAPDDAGGRVYVAGRASLRVLNTERFETLAQAHCGAAVCGSHWA